MNELESRYSQYSFLAVLLAIGLTWLRSSWGKLNEGNFSDSLGGTLTKFASNNPYPWYKNFLEQTAIPNSRLFGQMTMWGELMVAVSLTLSVLYLLFMPTNKLAVMILALGLLGGMFLNAVFWLAAGHTSPSTNSVNLLMFGIEVIGFVYAMFLLKSLS